MSAYGVVLVVLFAVAGLAALTGACVLLWRLRPEHRLSGREFLLLLLAVGVVVQGTVLLFAALLQEGPLDRGRFALAREVFTSLVLLTTALACFHFGANPGAAQPPRGRPTWGPADPDPVPRVERDPALVE